MLKCFLLGLDPVAGEAMVIDPLPADGRLKVECGALVPLDPQVIAVVLYFPVLHQSVSSYLD